MRGSLLDGLEIQCRVIGALLLREIITRYGRYNIGVLWLFFEPMMFTSGVTVLWSNFFPYAGRNVSIVGFTVTGYSCVLLWRNTVNRAAFAIEGNRSLLYHRNLKALDCVFASVILEAIGATASFTLLTIFFASIELMPWPQDLLPVLAGWLLMCWFAFALGLLIAAARARSEFLGRIWHIGTYLMLPISGAAFMVDWLPPSWREMALWVPIVHGSELIRHGYFAGSVRTYEDPAYLAVVNMFLTLIGLAMVRDATSRVHTK